MTDFTPPPGPPPPKVPEGWKAQWNDQYKEWFFVNIHTKQSQWEKPTEPAYPVSHDATAPPGYSSGSSFDNVSDKKKNPYETPSNTVDEDARLAAQLQAEENAKSRDAMNDYANTPMPQQNYGQQASYGSSSYGQTSQQAELPPRDQKKGLFSKLLGGKSHAPGHNQSAYNQYPQQGYGGYPQQGYGGYGQPGYGGGGGGYPPGGGYGGGYPPGGGYGYPPKKSGGMGAAGGAALGLGGGLVGGMLLGEALESHDNHEYNEGYQDGNQNADNQDYGGYGGGDGGDMGGGDMGGGDMGGGDF